jgi:hypothetical protein
MYSESLPQYNLCGPKKSFPIEWKLAHEEIHIDSL